MKLLWLQAIFLKMTGADIELLSSSSYKKEEEARKTQTTVSWAAAEQEPSLRTPFMASFEDICWVFFWKGNRTSRICSCCCRSYWQAFAA